MATHSSILAWRIPRTEEPGGFISPQGCKGSDTTEKTQCVHTHTHQHTRLRMQINSQMNRLGGFRAQELLSPWSLSSSPSQYVDVFTNQEALKPHSIENFMEASLSRYDGPLTSFSTLLPSQRNEDQG